MSLRDWLMDKRIERQTRDPKEKLKFTRVSFAFWCVFMLVWGYLYMEDIMRGGIGEDVFYYMFLLLIPMLIMSFKNAFVKGFAKTWYLPIVYGMGIYFSVILGTIVSTSVAFVSLYARLRAFGRYDLWIWMAPSVLGVLLGSFCGLFKRK